MRAATRIASAAVVVLLKYMCAVGTTEISFFAPYTSGEEPIILQFYFPRAHISPPFIHIVKRSHAVLTQEIETPAAEIECNCMAIFHTRCRKSDEIVTKKLRPQQLTAWDVKRKVLGSYITEIAIF